MAILRNITWTCDLCGDTGSTVSDKVLPDDWMSLELDHPIAEREWITKHLCGDCVVKVGKNYGARIQQKMEKTLQEHLLPKAQQERLMLEKSNVVQQMAAQGWCMLNFTRLGVERLVSDETPVHYEVAFRRAGETVQKAVYL